MPDANVAYDALSVFGLLFLLAMLLPLPLSPDDGDDERGQPPNREVW